MLDKLLAHCVIAMTSTDKDVQSLICIPVSKACPTAEHASYTAVSKLSVGKQVDCV